MTQVHPHVRAVAATTTFLRTTTLDLARNRSGEIASGYPGPMAQVKIYGRASALRAMRQPLSDVIHSCTVEALAFPRDKRFHRFIPLAAEDFIYPSDRSERYTVIEVLMFEGRTVEAKKVFIRSLYERAAAQLELAAIDLELTFIETPRHNWGIRGVPGDELALGYTVEV